MRAVNLIPADERGGAGVGAGQLRRQRLRRARRCSACSRSSRSSTASPAADLQTRAPKSRRSTPGRSRRRRRPPSWRPTRASSRCANSACRRSTSSSTRASTGPTPSTNSVACCPDDASLSSLTGTIGASGAGTSSAPSSSTASSGRGPSPPRPRPAASPRSRSAAARTSQTEVAQMLDAPAPDRRRQRSHAAELRQAAHRRWRRAAAASACPPAATHVRDADHLRRRCRAPPATRAREPRRDSDAAGDRRGVRHGSHGSEHAMTGRDRIVLIALVVARRARRRLGARRLARAQEGGQLSAQVSSAQTQLVDRRKRGRAARAPRRPSYPTAYASIVSLGKAVPASEEVPSLIYQLAQATEEKHVEFSSITAGAAARQPEPPAEATPAAVAPRASPRCPSRSSSTAPSSTSKPLPPHQRLRRAHRLRQHGEQRPSARRSRASSSTPAAASGSSKASGRLTRDDHRERLRAARRARALTAGATATLADRRATPSGSASSELGNPSRDRESEPMSDFFASLKADLLDRRLLPILVVLGDRAARRRRLRRAQRRLARARRSPSRRLPPERPRAIGIVTVSHPATPNTAVAETTEGQAAQHHGHRPRSVLAAAAGEASGGDDTRPARAPPRAPPRRLPPGRLPLHRAPAARLHDAEAKPTPAKPKVYVHYHVTACSASCPRGRRHRRAARPLKTYKTCLDEPLPRKSNPQLVFLGVMLRTGKEALIHYRQRSDPARERRCQPSTTQCQAIDLKSGRPSRSNTSTPTASRHLRAEAHSASTRPARPLRARAETPSRDQRTRARTRAPGAELPELRASPQAGGSCSPGTRRSPRAPTPRRSALSHASPRARSERRSLARPLKVPPSK